jgi:hypothetical protein
LCKQIVIWFWLLLAFPALHAQIAPQKGYISIEIFGDTLKIPAPHDFNVAFESPLQENAILSFYREINRSAYVPLISSLLHYKESQNLNDWFYYQLIRKVAQKFAPKNENYYRYTLYKWFLMVKSGYDASLAIHNNQLLFYIWSNDEVYNVPLYQLESKQYVCLNIHDYIRASENFSAKINLVEIREPSGIHPFSYAVSQMPDFKEHQYHERQLRFPYGENEYVFRVKMNPQVQQIFANYPIVDFGTYFNIPLSKSTYESLVPSLKKQLKNLTTKNGVEYLMKFTRNAFLYEDDQNNFGREKRMGPEETLLSTASDCDDRAALFFFLVKEIYNLPMVALLYENHVAIAVQFKKGYGKTIVHNGKRYSVCEPTPQLTDLSIGKIAPGLRHQPFQVVYAYNPN